MDPIDQVTRDCFGVLIQLRRLDPGALPDLQVLHQRCCWFLDTMIHRAREANLRQDDVADVTYAICALADELALSIPGAMQQFWMANLLQLRYFNENVAGENFFHRLQALRADPQRAGALRVYYLCLVLGFQGRYRVRGGDTELAQLVESLQYDLARYGVLRDEVLSPRAARPTEALVGGRRALPIVGLSVAAILIAVGLNLGLHITLDAGVRGVVGRIATLAGGGK